MANSTALVAMERVDAIELYTGGRMDDILDGVREKAAASAGDADASTAAGRKTLASTAHRVARTKTLLDELGKELVAEQKETIKKVDAERKRMRDELDALKVSVRAPLTAWEAADKAAGAEVERLRALTAAGQPLEECEALLEALSTPAADIPREWLEAYTEALQAARQRIQADAEAARKREQERAELERLRAEAAERERAEAERRKAEQEEREAKRRAEAAAEAARQEERRRAEQALREEKERAEREKMEAIEAERRRQEAVIAEQKAEQERERREHEAAEAARRKEQQEREQRERDEQHRSAVQARAVECLKKAGFERGVAQGIVELVAAGKIDGMTMIY